MTARTLIRRIALVLIAASPLVPFAVSLAGDDADLFSGSAIPPNVLLGFDSSSSMRENMFPPFFDAAEIDPGCTITASTGSNNHLEIDQTRAGFVDINDDYTCMQGGGMTAKRGYVTASYCGNTRQLWVDPQTWCDAVGSGYLLGLPDPPGVANPGQSIAMSS